MALQLRTVLVRQLPETVNDDQEWAFMQELKSCMQVDRPRIVLNCSSVRALDRTVLHLLLCCLEEAMKRNGDVRLSALPKPAQAALESVGMRRLFKVFDTDADAVKSFQRLPILTIPEPARAEEPLPSETAMLPLQATENAA